MWLLRLAAPCRFSRFLNCSGAGNGAGRSGVMWRCDAASTPVRASAGFSRVGTESKFPYIHVLYIPDRVTSCLSFRPVASYTPQ